MSRPKTKGARLNLRLPEDLHLWAKDFAQRQNPKTTVTELLTKHLLELREKDTSNANQ